MRTKQKPNELFEVWEKQRKGRKYRWAASGWMVGCFREVFSAAVVLLACPCWAVGDVYAAENPPFPARPGECCSVFICLILFYEIVNKCLGLTAYFRHTSGNRLSGCYRSYSFNEKEVDSTDRSIRLLQAHRVYQ